MERKGNVVIPAKAGIQTVAWPTHHAIGRANAFRSGFPPSRGRLAPAAVSPIKTRLTAFTRERPPCGRFRP